MSALDRAQRYAGIFLKAGDDWPNYVPVDAVRQGATVHLGDVVMRPFTADSWRLTQGDETWTIALTAGASS